MTGPSRLTLAVVRSAVGKRVDATSLRAVADEVGMSFSGLRSFLDGRSPQLRTREKLVRWYEAQAERVPDAPREDLEMAIALVRSYVRDGSKARTVRERRLQQVIDRLKDDD